MGGDVPLLYATGATALTTLSHYIGYIFGKKRAKPEYQKVGDLEKKVETMQDTYGSMTIAQPKYGELSRYEKELRNKINKE